ncbi:winged helix-turn-helix transcriptional regulator [Albidovulum sp.]|jgi:DNA-binding HxlR family transcriptional regulator|uniref:winged helix-turn-helix transcriptional regulator n=1 Tax=Albidovulum sp. TaxID=1872424 RepID=UPI00306736CC
MTSLGETPRPKPRSVYDEGCIAAHALDLLGDRWALLVIRELMLGPKRFALIRSGLPGISASVLTQRLEGLEAGGLLRRVILPDPAGVQVYDLTAPGRAARPVLDALCRFGARLPGHDPAKPISPTALMLSMAAMIDRRAAKAVAMRAGFDLGRETFRGALLRGRWEVERGAAEGDIVFAGSANALAPVIYGTKPLVEWISAGAVAFRGDPAAGQRFVDLFRLERRARPRGRAWSRGG